MMTFCPNCKDCLSLLPCFFLFKQFCCMSQDVFLNKAGHLEIDMQNVLMFPEIIDIHKIYILWNFKHSHNNLHLYTFHATCIFCIFYDNSEKACLTSLLSITAYIYLDFRY